MVDDNLLSLWFWIVIQAWIVSFGIIVISYVTVRVAVKYIQPYDVHFVSPGDRYCSGTVNPPLLGRS